MKSSEEKYRAERDRMTPRGVHVVVYALVNQDQHTAVAGLSAGCWPETLSIDFCHVDQKDRGG